MSDSLIRIVLVGTATLPAFVLGFWAGSRSRLSRRPARAELPVALPARESAGGASDGDAGTRDTTASAEAEGDLGDVTPLRPAMEGGGSRTAPPK